MFQPTTSSPSPVPLLDERRHLAHAAEAAIGGRVQHLSEVAERGPGAYLMLYCGDLDMYARAARAGGPTSLLEGGGYPIYAGSAASLIERRQRHVRNLEGLIDLSEDDLRIVLVPTTSEAGAGYVEKLFIRAFEPVWNQPWLAGFGSKRQGRIRERGQRVSPWNVLHPGRYIHPSAPRPIATQADLAGKVVNYLAGTVSPVYEARRS